MVVNNKGRNELLKEYSNNKIQFNQNREKSVYDSFTSPQVQHKKAKQFRVRANHQSLSHLNELNQPNSDRIGDLLQLTRNQMAHHERQFIDDYKSKKICYF